MSKDKYRKLKWESLVQLAMILFLLSMAAQAVEADTPVSQNGRFCLCGTHLCNANDYPIHLLQ